MPCLFGKIQLNPTRLGNQDCQSSNSPGFHRVLEFAWAFFRRSWSLRRCPVKGGKCGLSSPGGIHRAATVIHGQTRQWTGGRAQPACWEPRFQPFRCCSLWTTHPLGLVLFNLPALQCESLSSFSRFYSCPQNMPQQQPQQNWEHDVGWWVVLGTTWLVVDEDACWPKPMLSCYMVPTDKVSLRLVLWQGPHIGHTSYTDIVLTFLTCLMEEEPFCDVEQSFCMKPGFWEVPTETSIGKHLEVLTKKLLNGSMGKTRRS